MSSKDDDEVEEVICPLCEKERATRECEACGEALCSKDDCQRRLTTLHETARKNRHKVKLVPISQKSARLQPGECIHHKEKLSLFCLECRVPVCSECVTSGRGKHFKGETKHKCCKIEEAAKKLRASLEDDVAQLVAVRAKIEEARRAHGAAEKVVEDGCSARIVEIDTTFDEVERKLKERRAVMVGRCKHVAQKKVRAIREIEESLRAQIEIAENEMKAVSAAASAEDAAVCNLAPTLHDRVAEFFKETMKGEIDVVDTRLDFRCASVPMVQSISAFGSVVCGGEVDLKRTEFDLGRTPREVFTKTTVTIEVIVRKLLETSGEEIAVESPKGKRMLNSIEVVVEHRATAAAAVRMEFKDGMASSLDATLESPGEHRVLVRSRDSALAQEEPRQLFEIVAANVRAEEARTLEALDGMDGKKWADVRDRLMVALTVDPFFVPALILVRAIRQSMPLVFKQGDITPEAAIERAKAAAPEKRESGKQFCRRLLSCAEESGSRQFLAGKWQRLIEGNHEEAAKLFRRSADLGNANAQFMVGLCFENGTGVAKDLFEAARYYRLAAGQGLAEAQNNLGECLRDGWGLAKDPVEAVGLFRRAAEAGSVNALFNLGMSLEQGTGVAKDAAEAARSYRLAAEQGLAEAQSNLAACLRHGVGVAKDAAQAAKWYRLAAEQGLAVAQNSLAWALSSGEGVPKDAVEAAQWYRKAAEQGLAEAQNSWGWCLKNGRGVAKDLVQAAQWYLKAAAQDDAEAQNALGLCYHDGEGLPKDPAEAIRWYRKAAMQGNAWGQNNLGYCFENGFGVTKDLVEAARWFKLAAEQKNVAAQFNFARCLENGWGVAKDQTEAIRWYEMAAKQGNTTAKEVLKRLLSKK